MYLSKKIGIGTSIVLFLAKRILDLKLYDYLLNPSSQRKVKYNWCDPDHRGIGGRFSLPRWRVFPAYRQAGVPRRKNMDIGVIADVHIKSGKNTAKELFLIRRKKIHLKIFTRLF